MPPLLRTHHHTRGALHVNRRPRLPDDFNAEAAARYQAGASLRIIATELGAHPTTIRNRLKSAGVPLRPPGQPIGRARLIDALADCVVKATEYGKQDGGFVAYYLLPTGPIHRVISLLQELGVTVRPGFDGRHKPTTDPQGQRP
jgi:hypothetical protein